MSMTRIRGTRQIQLVWLVERDTENLIDGSRYTERYIETRRLTPPKAWEAVGCILSSAL